MLQTYLYFFMLHVVIMPVVICFSYTLYHFYTFSGTVARDLEASARGVSHILSLYFVIFLPSIFLLVLFFLSFALKLKNIQKKIQQLVSFCFA